MRFRGEDRCHRAVTEALDNLSKRLPPLEGAPIEVAVRASITTECGHAGHAASDIRRRIILIEDALLEERGELARILVHELFHFSWVRLGNRARWNWEAILQAEWRGRARGELGLSAKLRKTGLRPRDVDGRGRRWREYACESYCDAAAWLFSGAASSEYTLSRRWRLLREEWFRNSFPPGERIRL